jgi:predicted nuclease of predicted toxin-antitoxin system
MKFLVDAQLPVRLARFLQTSGHDAIHTKDLPQQNSTSDTQINNISIQQERIVITKDSDFVNSFLTIQKPYKLLLITTGNIKNSELEEIFVAHLSTLVTLFEQYHYLELSSNAIIAHQ